MSPAGNLISLLAKHKLYFQQHPLQQSIYLVYSRETLLFAFLTICTDLVIRGNFPMLFIALLFELFLGLFFSSSMDFLSISVQLRNALGVALEPLHHNLAKSPCTERTFLDFEHPDKGTGILLMQFQ